MGGRGESAGTDKHTKGTYYLAIGSYGNSELKKGEIGRKAEQGKIVK